MIADMIIWAYIGGAVVNLITLLSSGDAKEVGPLSILLVTVGWPVLLVVIAAWKYKAWRLQ